MIISPETEAAIRQAVGSGQVSVLDDTRVYIPYPAGDYVKPEPGADDYFLNGLLAHPNRDFSYLPTSETNHIMAPAYASATGLELAARGMGLEPGKDIFRFEDVPGGRFPAEEYLLYIAKGTVPLALDDSIYARHDRNLGDHIPGWLCMPKRLQDILQTSALHALTQSSGEQEVATKAIDALSAAIGHVATPYLTGGVFGSQLSLESGSRHLTNAWRLAYPDKHRPAVFFQWLMYRFQHQARLKAHEIWAENEKARPSDFTERPLRRLAHIALRERAARYHL